MNEISNKEIQVLVIDDEENILSSLKRLFMQEPYKIATTTDVDEAWAILEREKIKVVMSDERMPNVSGVKFLSDVKAKYPNIVRILFTGYADLKSAEDAINIGQVFRFINKPWNTEDLKATVSQALKHYELLAENKLLVKFLQAQNDQFKELNEKLKSMYEVQKDFSSTVSHELRTPLASIKAAIDIVMSETPGALTDDQKKFLNKAKTNVDRLNRLISDILDLSKLEAGKAPLELAARNINEIIEEVVDTQNPVAQKKNIYLKMELDQNMIPMQLDCDRLVQVLSNLINNAIKFTNEGGITIKSEANISDNNIKVSVCDTGPGISQEDMSKLFNKFQQLGDPSTRQTGGTGLGLVICKEIVELHNGKIAIESKIGEGSNFYFILPLSERRGAQ